MIGGIIGAVVRGLAAAVLSWLQGLFAARAQIEQGRTQQALAETTTSAETSHAMEDAGAQAPQTDGELAQRLKDGSF